MATSAEMA
jgi:hypothetical protein